MSGVPGLFARREAGGGRRPRFAVPTQTRRTLRFREGVPDGGSLFQPRPACAGVGEGSSVEAKNETRMQPLDRDAYKKVVILTGAGISVASGIAPFRGPGGFWNENDHELVGTAQAQANNPLLVWQTYAPLRAQVRRTQPNPAHFAVAEYQKRVWDHCWVCVLTQNVDGLHQRAGAKGVLEMHGSLRRSRCCDPNCAQQPYLDDYQDPYRLPACPTCRGPARMDIVLFNEEMAWNVSAGMMEAMRDCELFIAIGTSGMVMPAAGLVELAKTGGARTILVNLEPTEQTAFDEVYLGKAEELVPQLLGPGRAPD